VAIVLYFATSNYNKVLLTVLLGLSESGYCVTLCDVQLQYMATDSTFRIDRMIYS